MDQRAPANPAVPLNSTSTARDTTSDCRNVWILTGYIISFLTLGGVLAYYFSGYITH
jgi:hypothetical protein